MVGGTCGVALCEPVTAPRRRLHTRAQPGNTPASTCARGEGNGCQQTSGCCRSPDLHAGGMRPRAAAFPPRHIHTGGHASPQPWEAGCVPPHEAPQCWCCHAAAPCSPLGPAQQSKAEVGSPGPPSHCSPLSNQPSRVLGTSVSPAAEPEVPAQNLRELCVPLPLRSPPQGRDCAGWQPLGPPLNLLCPQCWVRGAGRDPVLLPYQPCQGKAQLPGLDQASPKHVPLPGHSQPRPTGACSDLRGICSVRGRATFQGWEIPPRPNVSSLNVLQRETRKLVKEQDLSAGLSGSLPSFSLTIKVAFEAAQLLPKERAASLLAGPRGQFLFDAGHCP